MQRSRPKRRHGHLEGDRNERPANTDQSVIDSSSSQSPDGDISVTDGTNLRHLRGGLGLCAPGIPSPAFRAPKPFRKAVRSTLLSVCNINLLTPEKIRPIDLLNVIKENFLDKGREV